MSEQFPPPGAQPGQPAGPPPAGPPAAPPAGAPGPGQAGPPQGPPGYGPPPGHGAPPTGPGPAGPPPGGPGSPGGTGNSRKWAIGIGAVVAVAAVAVAGAIVIPKVMGSDADGGWGAAEAMPDTAFGYVGFDLSDDQLEPAVDMLLKFPALADQMEVSGGADVREQLFTEMAGDIEESCDVSWDDDVTPWLGDQLGIAGVDFDGEPAPIVAVQSTDDGAAEDAMGKLGECAGDEFAFTVTDGWVLIGTSQDHVDQAADDAGSSPLSDDSDFGDWTSEVGDPGLLTAYASPEAGKYIGEVIQESSSMSGGLGLDDGATDLYGEDDFDSTPGFFEEVCPGLSDPSALEDQQSQQMEDFGGAAVSLRFADGSLEIDAASQTADETPVGSEAGDLVGSLPADTAAAVGVSLGDDWVDQAMSGLETVCGEGFDADAMMGQLSDATGLDLPDDLTTLTGDAMALSVGSEIDPMGMASAADVPAALKIRGDADDIEGVLDKVRGIVSQGLGGSDMGMLDSDSDGGDVAIGPNAEYRDKVLHDNGLSGDSTYKKVVQESGKAGAVVFVNFNQLDQFGGMMGEAGENIETLDGLGISAWMDDSTAHTALRLSTD